jgi:hypothetical protein
MTELLTSKEVCKRLGIKRDRLNYWAKKTGWECNSRKPGKFGFTLMWEHGTVRDIRKALKTRRIRNTPKGAQNDKA